MKTMDEIWAELIGEDESGQIKIAKKAGDIIAQLITERYNQKLTQKELAERAGLTQSAVARLENLDALPRLDTLLKVVDALGMELVLVDEQSHITCSEQRYTTMDKYITKGTNQFYVHQQQVA